MYRFYFSNIPRNVDARLTDAIIEVADRTGLGTKRCSDGQGAVR